VSLEDRLESGLPSAWRPDQKDPDTIIGEVLEIQVGTSDYAPYPLLIVRQDDGTEKAIHGFHTVLKNELLRHKPQVGERLGVKYLGEQETKPGSKFKSFIGYRVHVDRAAAAFDWGKLGEPEVEDEVYRAPEPEPVTVPANAQDDSIPF
jgi:hypothetical protein